jgi:site-specific DNA recombinase
MYRTSTRSTARKFYYYRCFGSDAYRHLRAPLCAEIERRLAATRDANPTKRRVDSLQRDLTRKRKGMERLITAYQEILLSRDELLTRMPELRRREQTLQAEIKTITGAQSCQERCKRLHQTKIGATIVCLIASCRRSPRSKPSQALQRCSTP